MKKKRKSRKKRRAAPDVRTAIAVAWQARLEQWERERRKRKGASRRTWRSFSHESLLRDKDITLFSAVLHRRDVVGEERHQIEDLLIDEFLARHAHQVPHSSSLLYWVAEYLFVIRHMPRTKSEGGRPIQRPSPRALLDFIERQRGKYPKTIWANASKEFGITDRTLNRTLKSVGIKSEALRARLRRIYSRR